ncbi:hypothetical protein K488DRAFT_47952 [Vararia minispora EC-137]|uniref:Uncharacterized protein n=1 Tax=Vararia minispora EC-137 TaxID=1314806 RepID=A0ACB8QNC2_9AGAM|nr:hypothetical protein K488DRAFT_47952 [Vararia minispora EC-137]
MDSITLGQLKAMQSYYDFKYDDEDTMLNEFEEFYSYVEMPQVAENMKAWEGSFQGEWTKAPYAKRRAHVELLLESLEHKDVAIRFTNARRLLYVLQGVFAETTSQEHQLHWIFDNCRLVRAANGVPSIVEAIKIASAKHDFLSLLSDGALAHVHLTQDDRAEVLEEINTEISVYLGMLYHLVEIFKGYDDFAEELMSLDPPLPVYFFNIVGGLRDKSAKGYPVKKLLLVLWKSLLACCGGVRDLARVKKLSRELAGLPPIPENAIPIKSSPLDIEAFHQETSVKFPTFSPPVLHNRTVPPTIHLPTAKLAEAYSPIPVRHHYAHDEADLPPLPPPSHGVHGGASGGAFRPQPPTPAASPPPAPKPKKQQYQTDPTRPFLFPFSRKKGEMMLVPFAIEEADTLYHRHMYVSLALWQMWRTREACMTVDSGLEHMPGAAAADIDAVGEQLSKLTINTESEVAALPDIALLDAKIAEVDQALRRDDGDRRALRARREDLMRLKRVEQIYAAILPMMSNVVLVLLKLLLAIVSASSNGQQPPPSASSGFPPGVASPQDPPHAPGQPMTLEETDIVRHREITTKALSAIILLTLKWFKVSHVMKFHYLGQHLLDTNCLLLVMKMYGMQDVSTTVVTRTESPNHNFFRFCLLNFSKNPQLVRSEDYLSGVPPRRTIIQTTRLPNGSEHQEEIDMLTEFSWRNFFATINFAKIMQKLSKGMMQRIRMLVQYKSTAILKRILKVQHPVLQLHILKLIKSQVPYSGRRWRQTNMQVITSIYLNCRPDLRDEWLTPYEGDDTGEAQEQALRQLVRFYNTQRYGAQAPMSAPGAHRRSVSMSHHLEALHSGGEISSGMLRPVGAPATETADVFPPPRAQAPDPRIFLPYITEDIAFEEEYEEYLSDLGWTDSESESERDRDRDSAWSRLPDLARGITDDISDSESIAEIGDIGEAGRDELGRDSKDLRDENQNNWEHMSPKTMAALTKSPAGPGARRSSSSERLRPVLPFGLDDAALAVDFDIEDEDGEELGPMPRDQPFSSSGGGVDEVEYAYGCVSVSRLCFRFAC